jgi:hypothetical protein
MPGTPYAPLILALALGVLFVGLIAFSRGHWRRRGGGAVRDSRVALAATQPRSESRSPPCLKLRCANACCRLAASGASHPAGIGVWTLVLTEAAIFAYLLFSYFYLASQANGDWPLGGVPSLKLAVAQHLHFAIEQRRAHLGRAQRGSQGSSLAASRRACALAHSRNRLCDRATARVARPSRSRFIRALMAPVTSPSRDFISRMSIVGLLMLLRCSSGRCEAISIAQRHAPLTIGAIYWHFVDVVWLIVFTALYIVPRFR